MRSSQHTIRDYTLYVAITIAVVGATLASASYKVARETFVHWGAFTGTTFVVFGYIIGENRTLWSKRSFWFLAVVALAVHCLMFAKLTHLKLAWSGTQFAGICFVELLVLVGLTRSVYGSERRAPPLHM